jgi:cell division protein FtsB
MSAPSDARPISSYASVAWLLPFALLVFAVVAVPLRILSEEGLPRYRKLQTQLARLQRDNASLTRSIEHLSRDVSALRSDPAAVERIARDELGLIRQGEVVFQFTPSGNLLTSSGGH